MKTTSNFRRKWKATTAVCIVSTMAIATAGFAASNTGRSIWDLRSHPNRFLNADNRNDQDNNNKGKNGKDGRDGNNGNGNGHGNGNGNGNA